MTYASLTQALDAMTLSEGDQDFQALLQDGEELALLQSSPGFADEVMDRLFNQPSIAGTPCLIPKLEDKVRFPPGQVTLWYGINGHGKSLLTSQVAMDLAVQGEPVLICSFEMSPAATIVRMIKQAGGTATPSRAWAEAWLDWAAGKVWIYNRRGQAPTKALLTMVRYAAEKKGIRHALIDSLMKCVKSEEDYDGQKAFVDQLCQLSLSAGIHAHLVHHVRKGQDESEMPNKFAAKGSGAVADQVDCAIGVWRNKRKEEKRRQGKDVEDSEPDAILIIDKNRHIEWEGRLGLYYLPGVQGYTDVRGRAIRYPEIEKYMGGAPV
jgi:twinkle protein